MNLKKILSLALALLMLVSLSACGKEPQPAGPEATSTQAPATTADYTVKVVDALGKPYTSGIIVRILKDGEQMAMQKVDENGTVTKTLDKGEYTVELMYTDSNAAYVYDQTSAILTGEQTSLEINLALAQSGENIQLFQQVDENGKVEEGSGLNAYHVTAGCTQVELTPNQRNYFLFVPQEAGEYHISAIGDMQSIGHYGSPFFMSNESVTPVENNTIVVHFYADMISGGSGTDVMLLGIDAGDANKCILSVNRVGDPAWTPEQEPYVVYATTAKLAAYTLPEGKTPVEFDLTAASDAYPMELGEDGFYHLNTPDGPLVLAKLGVDNPYMACYKTVLTKTGVRAYFYDENGNFLRREKYDDCLREYFEVMDQKAGVYPLTEDLMYIIQTHGGYCGWWTLDKETSIFQDNDGNPIPGINADIAWLFMCSYIAE